MAVKYFVKGFDGRIDMGVCKHFNLAFPGFDNDGRIVIEFKAEILTSIFHVHESDIEVKVNGCVRTINDSLGRIFDNTDEVKSLVLIAKDDKLHIEVAIKR